MPSHTTRSLYYRVSTSSTTAVISYGASSRSLVTRFLLSNAASDRDRSRTPNAPRRERSSEASWTTGVEEQGHVLDQEISRHRQSPTICAAPLRDPDRDPIGAATGIRAGVTVGE